MREDKNITDWMWSWATCYTWPYSEQGVTSTISLSPFLPQPLCDSGLGSHLLLFCNVVHLWQGQRCAVCTNEYRCHVWMERYVFIWIHNTRCRLLNEVLNNSSYGCWRVATSRGKVFHLISELNIKYVCLSPQLWRHLRHLLQTNTWSDVWI